MKKILIVLAAVLVVAACSQNSKKEGGTVAVAPAPVAGEQSPAATTSPAPLPTPTNALLPEVAAKYKGVKLEVTKLADKTKSNLSVPFGAKTVIDGTPLLIEVESLFPSFTMVEGGMANKSLNEDNPGAKVKIYKAGAVIFDGWLFQNFPEMHGLEDPEYSVVMVGSVLK